MIKMEQVQRKPNRIYDYDYSQNGAYFVTICTQDRKKLLSKIAVGTHLPGCPQEMHLKLLWHGEIAEKYIKQINSYYNFLSIDKYIIMPDHIHFLIVVHGHSGRSVPTQKEERTSMIARFVGTFKRFCNKEYGENVWQGRYYDHVIRNQQDYDEIWSYIENNPIKWTLEKQGSL